VVATLDATLIETHKREALPCYKGFKAYQPLNCWWAEHGVVLHSEFRDGNVPAGYQQLRVLKDCLAAAAATGITKVYLRRRATSRTCCCTVEKARFGVIEFSADVTEEFRKATRADADWQPLYRTVSVTRPTRSSPRSASCQPGTAGGVPTTASWRSANPCGIGRRRAVAVSHRGVRRQLQAVRHRHQPHAAR
jgi:hypothetical protein